MDSGPSSQSLKTSRKRVWSPSAAKMGAECFTSDRAVALLGLGLVCLSKVRLDQRHLDAPTLLVRGKGFGTARKRDRIETGLGEGEQDSVRRLLQSKDDQGCWLLRIIDGGIDGAGMPAE